MNGMLVDSNVYYLPVAPAVDDIAVEPEPPRFTSRLRNAWWRLRLAFAEVRGILRPPHGRLPADEYAALMDETFAPAPRRSQPAVIIDFESARARLRPAREA